MATKAQILANCRNALKSTGPRTRQSKAATSQNAAKRTFKTNLVKIRVICGYSLYRTNPILRKSQMNVTSFDKGKYVKLDTWSDETNKPNQTQFKANLQNDKNERKLFFNRQLRRKLSRMATPKQTQSNPIQIEAGRRSLRASFSEPANRGPNFKTGLNFLCIHSPGKII